MDIWRWRGFWFRRGTKSAARNWSGGSASAAENFAWVQRLAPLVFGHYAWREGEVAVVKSAGSGVFVASRLGLSARHVSRSYEHLDDQFDAARRRFTPLDDKHTQRIIDGTKFSTLLYQLPVNYNGPGSAMGPLQWPAPDELLPSWAVQRLFAGKLTVWPDLLCLWKPNGEDPGSALAIEVDLGGEPVKTVLMPKTLELIGFLTAWTAAAPAAILLLNATARRRDSLRQALALAVGDFLLAVETLSAFFDTCITVNSDRQLDSAAQVDGWSGSEQ